MPPFPRHPVFYSVLILFAVITATAAWRLRASFRAVQTLQRGLQQKRAELESAKATLMQASPDQVAELNEALVRATQAAARHEQAIPRIVPNQGEHHDPRANSTDAFFDLAVFAERMRSKARSFEVRVRPEERFGFAEFSTRGPTNDAIDAIARQRFAMEFLLERLFAARPREFIAIQRVQPADDADGVNRRVATRVTSRESTDFFEFDRRLSVRVPGVVNTDPIRVSFRANTTVLRMFLNALSSSDAPCSVRSVSVDPGRRSRQETVTADDMKDERIVVQNADSIFVVTVEFLQVVDPVSLASAQ